VQHLALIHQILDCSGDVLDRHLRIDRVLVEKVNAVGTKPLQHRLDSHLDVVRSAIQPRFALASFGVDVPAELGRDDDLVSEWFNAFPKDSLDL
jgi:hypothetical protein